MITEVAGGALNVVSNEARTGDILGDREHRFDFDV